LPSLSYVAIIRTGSGYMFGFAPKFTLLLGVPPVEGISASPWGGEEPHDMTRKLND